MLAWGNVANASITDWSANDDNDGAIVCDHDNTCFDYDTNVLSIAGAQYWGPGHILGTFTTDTEMDPTVTVRNIIGNDTGSAWTGYDIDVSMNKSFTLFNPVVYSPGDWSVASVVQQSPSEWTVDLAAGTPVQDGQSLDFSYQMTFTGGVSYTQTMTPVPEPSTLTGWPAWPSWVLAVAPGIGVAGGQGLPTGPPIEAPARDRQSGRRGPRFRRKSAPARRRCQVRPVSRPARKRGSSARDAR